MKSVAEPYSGELSEEQEKFEPTGIRKQSSKVNYLE